MLTFTDQQNIAKEISGLSDASSVARFKRDINTGASLFMNKLGRPYNRMSRFANMVANQQFYQIPEDAMRPSKIRVKVGTIWYFVDQVSDEDKWTLLNQTNQTSTRPTHYFVKGFDEFGLYPTPSATTTDSIELVFEPEQVLLTQDDYTTGSLTVTIGSQTVTGTSTIFMPSMVNRYLEISDGTDGNWYRVSAYASPTSISIENYYQGLSGAVSNGGWRIGEVSKLPKVFQEAPVDYAMYRHFTRRGDIAKGGEKGIFKTMFDTACELAKDLYGNTTSNQVIYVNNLNKVYNPLTDTPLNF